MIHTITVHLDDEKGRISIDECAVPAAVVIKVLAGVIPLLVDQAMAPPKAKVLIPNGLSLDDARKLRKVE